LSSATTDDSKVLFTDLSTREKTVAVPEHFFAFIELANNTRKRLLKTNQDLFLISGQHGIISALILLSYCAVWLLELGKKKGWFAKYFVLFARNIFFIFFIKF
jgi:hypothetical protein